jgi:hypothetical protein
MPPRTVLPAAMLHDKSTISAQSGPDACIEESVATPPRFASFLQACRLPSEAFVFLHRSKTFFRMRAAPMKKSPAVGSRWSLHKFR